MISARSELSPAGGVSLAGGLRFGPARLGLGVRWLSPRTLPSLPSAALEPSIDPYAGAWWSPDGRLAPLVGLTAGVSTRGYTQDGVEVERFVVGVAGLDAGASVRIGDGVDLVLLAHSGADASTTFVQVGGADAVALSPWELGGSVGLRGSWP